MKANLVKLGKLLLAALVTEAKGPRARAIETALLRAAVAYLAVKLGLAADHAV